jgi:nitrogen regulatory protein PII-like uncharacterized protein
MFANEKRSSLFCMNVSEEKVPDIDHRFKEYSSEKRWNLIEGNALNTGLILYNF